MQSRYVTSATVKRVSTLTSHVKKHSFTARPLLLTADAHAFCATARQADDEEDGRLSRQGDVRRLTQHVGVISQQQLHADGPVEPGNQGGRPTADPGRQRLLTNGAHRPVDLLPGMYGGEGGWNLAGCLRLMMCVLCADDQLKCGAS